MEAMRCERTCRSVEDVAGRREGGALPVCPLPLRAACRRQASTRITGRCGVSPQKGVCRRPPEGWAEARGKAFPRNRTVQNRAGDRPLPLGLLVIR